LRLLDELFLSQVPRFIARVESSPAVAEEVTQRLRERLLVATPDKPPAIATYSGRGSLRGWLRVSAVQDVYRLKRRKLDRAPAVDAVAARLVAAEPTPEVALMRARHGTELARAIKDTIAELPARERSLLKLHVLDGKTIDELGVQYEVHRATVARWIVHLKQRLYDEATRRLKERLALDTQEVNSLCQALQSQLEMSLNVLATSD
jgi:RNA polymerase sigma-70 factor (ECF subfamily)